MGTKAWWQLTYFQQHLVAVIVFETLVGGIVWLRYYSPWAWSVWG